MIAPTFAALACAIWIYLLVARGGFWRANVRDDAHAYSAIEPLPAVVAVIPARDEAESVGVTVRSLLQQAYAGDLRVVVVDDDSADGTAEVARRAAVEVEAAQRLTVLSAPPLPPGWTGKLWALNHGVDHALRSRPGYLLFTDADIGYAPDTLFQLVGRAHAESRVLVSLMAKLHCASWPERALIPAFVFFFQMLYPFAWANRARSSCAAAAGGCMLVRAESFVQTGGLAPIAFELIDDCALARRLKRQGPIWIGLTNRVHSLRSYASFSEIRGMVARTAYAQLRFSPLWLAMTVAGMALTYLVPPALAIFGSGVARALGIATWIAMGIAYLPILRFYRVAWGWAPALPLVALLYTGFTLDSAWQASRGRAGFWKGRSHAAPARKAGAR